MAPVGTTPVLRVFPERHHQLARSMAFTMLIFAPDATFLSLVTAL